VQEKLPGLASVQIPEFPAFQKWPTLASPPKGLLSGVTFVGSSGIEALETALRELACER
jgi:hypothetical protein